MKIDLALSTGWWYPASLGSALLLFILLMPKKTLTWREIYITFGMIGYLVWQVDMILAVPFDLFDVGDPLKEGISEVFLYGVIPSALSVIYLNFLNLKWNWKKRWLYAIVFAGISLFLEWLAIRVGLVKLKHWNILFSIPIHLAAYILLLPWHLKFIGIRNRK
jgi:hypothetical protein